MTSHNTPLTDQQLDEYEALGNNATLLGADIASPGILGVLVAEVRRLRAELAQARTETLTAAADKLDRIGHAAAAWILRDAATAVVPAVGAGQ